MKIGARALFGIVLSACNVPVPHGTAGGVIVEAGVPADATTSLDGSSAPRCGRGIVVVESDYASTNVGILALDGRVLQGSLASSATASVGLTAPLSGDVVLPTMTVPGNDVVLIDEAGSTNRLFWVDVATPTAKQRTLSVATGFSSDPQDYVQVSSTKAYVPRYNQNSGPSKEPFDRGNDVLIVDPSNLAITGSIDLRPALGSNATGALPDAHKIVVLGARAFVLLEALGTDVSATAPSRFVTIDVVTDAITNVLVLDGFENCTGLAVSPTGSSLAVLCSGAGNIQGNPSDVTDSGVVLIDVAGEPRIAKSFQAAAIGKNRIGFWSDYATANELVLQTFGYSDPSTGATAKDTLVTLDLTSGKSNVILDGDPFTIGGIACDVACSVCFVADSSRQGGVVHRFEVNASGALSRDQPIKVERNPGLPPVLLGKF